jgi:hypothetical protein
MQTTLEFVQKQLAQPASLPALTNPLLRGRFNWPIEPAANPWRTTSYSSLPARQFYQVRWDHAGPIDSIQARDWEEIEEYFVNQDMPSMVADIEHLLKRLVPEPIWEEDAFV